MLKYAHMQKIITTLWFNDNAEEAVQFYTGVFKRSRIVRTTYYSEAAATRLGRVPGSVLSISFKIASQDFLAINGGPTVNFTPAISLLVNCKSQREIDSLWKKLTDGGEPEQCGWLKDKFGVSWQIVPASLPDLMGDGREESDRVFAAMLEMQKIDIAALKTAREAVPVSEQEEPAPEADK